MDVQLTEAQRLLADSAREWLQRRWPQSAAVAYFEGQPLSPELWGELSGLGWLSVGVSEHAGGSRAVLSDAVVLQEELGAALFPTVFGSTLLVARVLDRALVRSPHLSPLLTKLMNGRLPAAFAAQERDSAFLASGAGTQLERRGPVYRLSGEKWFVRDAAQAGLFAVIATLDGERRAIVLIDADAVGVSLKPLEGSARDGQHRVILNAVEVPVERVIASEAAVEAALADAMVIEAARLAGVGARAHSMAISHAKNRVQFGRPIGSFQAIQHKVADMTTDVESSVLTTHYAAFQLDHGVDGLLHAMVAKLWASEAIQRVLREAHQIHGGVGYIVEHPLHMYFRNAHTGGLLFGSPHELIPAIATRLLEATDTRRSG